MAINTYDDDNRMHHATGHSHAAGMAAFAAYLMIITAIFQMITGIVAIFDPDFYLVSDDQLLLLNFTAWGWTHLILGAILLTAGLSLLSGKMWGRVAAVILATLSALANFAFLWAYPVWSALIIALDILIIYSVVTRKGWD